MRCKKCKKEIPDNSKFCNLCGTNQTIKTRNVKTRGNGQGTVFKTASGKYKVEVVLYYYVVDGKTKKKVRTATFDKKTDAINAISILRNKETVDNHTIFNLYQIGGKIVGSIPIMMVIYPLLSVTLLPIIYCTYHKTEIK